MNPQLLPAPSREGAAPWERTLYAFLGEKERRSGSKRTVDSYARLLWPFFERAGPPETIAPAHVLAWAYGVGASGREPSSATIGARIAALSSFYRFLIRMNVLAGNPCDAVERPRTVQSVARGLNAEEVRRLLAVVPDTVAGRRDRALLLVFVLTGRRRSEVIGLTAGDISLEGETAFYSYRGKGGKRGRRELPRPACEALWTTLGDARLSLAEVEPSASLWQAGAGPRGVTGSTFYARFRRYLALLFLQHMISKMKPVADGGSRIAIVFNSSPLMTGDAGSGESEIRRWIIENDWLEAVVALPDELFFNTNISTYFWIVTNRKSAQRAGRIQLIDARGFWEPMPRSLGQKRKQITDPQRAAIVQLHHAYADNEFSKTVSNAAFGYRRLALERPRRVRYRIWHG